MSQRRTEKARGFQRSRPLAVSTSTKLAGVPRLRGPEEAQALRPPPRPWEAVTTEQLAFVPSSPTSDDRLCRQGCRLSRSGQPAAPSSKPTGPKLPRAASWRGQQKINVFLFFSLLVSGPSVGAQRLELVTTVSGWRPGSCLQKANFGSVSKLPPRGTVPGRKVVHLFCANWASLQMRAGLW